jgi:hypothetical protein
VRDATSLAYGKGKEENNGDLGQRRKICRESCVLRRVACSSGWLQCHFSLFVVSFCVCLLPHSVAILLFSDGHLSFLVLFMLLVGLNLFFCFLGVLYSSLHALCRFSLSSLLSFSFFAIPALMLCV